MWEKERAIWREGMLAVGVDEAGRGPLVGPVVATAVSLKRGYSRIGEDESLWALIRDSKKLSPKRREEIFDFIVEHYHVGIGRVSAETIDRINILQSAFLAMKEAIASWKRKSGSDGIFLIDGNQEIPNMSISQRCVVGGDARVKCIAAASIVAKVTRDRELDELAQAFPLYGFERHKGYGTKEHMDALRALGPCPEHRKSFAPVRRCLRELREYGADV